MIYLTKTPIKTIDDIFDSAWNCSRQPMIFEFQRKDFNVIAMNNISGFVQLVLQYAILIKATDVVYYSKYDSIGTVQLGTPTTTTSVILTTIPYTTAMSGGFLNMNSYQDYSVNITLNIYNQNKNLFEKINTKISVDSSGKGKFYAQGLINNRITKENNFNYLSQNKLDKNSNSFFTLDYNASYRTSLTQTESSLSVIGQTNWWFVDAAKQLGSQYGQNLADYLPTNFDRDTKAKFLTSFAEPTNFIGYPFSLSFIYPEELEPATVTIKEEFVLNGAVVGTDDANIDSSQAKGVNHLMLTSTNVSGYDYINIWLHVGGVATRSYYNGGFIADEYFENIPPSPSVVEFDITQHQKVIINTPCNDDGIYIRFRNSLGGWDYWLFNHRRITTTESVNVENIIVDPDDIETGYVRSKSVKKKQDNTILLADYVDAINIDGFLQLQASPEVQILISDNYWHSVNVLNSSIPRKSGISKIQIEFKISLPDIYTVTN